MTKNKGVEQFVLLSIVEEVASSQTKHSINQ
jgi:hypothetical protein